MSHKKFWLTFLALGSMKFVLYWDKPLMAWLMECTKNWDIFRKVLWWVSHFGEGQYYVIPAVIFLGYSYGKIKAGTGSDQIQKTFNQAKWFLISFGVTAAFLHPLKMLFGRPRPSLAMQFDPLPWRPFTLDGHFHSLPSGHAQAAMTAALVCAKIWPKYKEWFFMWALIIGSSRVLLAKHFAGDVFAGYLLSSLVYFFVLKLDQKKL